MKRGKLLASLLLLTVVLVSGCELFGAESQRTCPLVARRGEADYFPLVVNDVSTFDYRARSGSIFGRTDHTGTLTWTIESVGECNHGKQPYVVLEEVEGIQTIDDFTSVSEQPFAYTQRFFLESIGDSVYVPGVAFPVLRFGQAPGPDTLTIPAHSCGSATRIDGDRDTLQIVQNRGVVFLNCSSSPGTSGGGGSAFWITRRD